MVSGVYSDDAATQWEATTQFRKLLSIGMSATRSLSCTCVLRSPLILAGWLHVPRCSLSNGNFVSAQNGVHQSKKWLQQVLYQDSWSSLFEQTSLSCRFYSSCFLAFALSISSALIIGFSNLRYTWDKESLLYVLYGPYCAWFDFCVNLLIDVSLKQRGLSPTLHLEHQITRGSSLIMVPSQSSFSFLALPAMMFVSRYVEQALGNGCCVDVEQLVSILSLFCRKQCGKERRARFEARVSRYHWCCRLFHLMESDEEVQKHEN